LLFLVVPIPDPMARRLELCKSVSIIQGTQPEHNKIRT
jgi:hypothetical protein